MYEDDRSIALGEDPQRVDRLGIRLDRDGPEGCHPVAELEFGVDPNVRCTIL